MPLATNASLVRDILSRSMVYAEQGNIRLAARTAALEVVSAGLARPDQLGLTEAILSTTQTPEQFAHEFRRFSFAQDVFADEPPPSYASVSPQEQARPGPAASALGWTEASDANASAPAAPSLGPTDLLPQSDGSYLVKATGDYDGVLDQLKGQRGGMLQGVLVTPNGDGTATIRLNQQVPSNIGAGVTFIGFMM